VGELRHRVDRDLPLARKALAISICGIEWNLIDCESR